MTQYLHALTALCPLTCGGEDEIPPGTFRTWGSGPLRRPYEVAQTSEVPGFTTVVPIPTPTGSSLTPVTKELVIKPRWEIVQDEIPSGTFRGGEDEIPPGTFRGGEDEIPPGTFRGGEDEIPPGTFR